MNAAVPSFASSVAAVIAEVLSASGHRVEVAHDGREARKRIQEGEVDLIITDLMMPHVSGHQLYEDVRRLSPELAARMIFSTDWPEASSSACHRSAARALPSRWRRM